VSWLGDADHRKPDTVASSVRGFASDVGGRVQSKKVSELIKLAESGGLGAAISKRPALGVEILQQLRDSRAEIARLHKWLTRCESVLEEFAQFDRGGNARALLAEIGRLRDA
jgi:hypothetical protein